MLYLFSTLVPALILIVGYLLETQKPKRFSDFVSLIVKYLPHLFGYAFFVYFLEMEKYLDVGWYFPTLMLFLLPIATIALILKLIFWIKGKNSAV